MCIALGSLTVDRRQRVSSRLLGLLFNSLFVVDILLRQNFYSLFLIVAQTVPELLEFISELLQFVVHRAFLVFVLPPFLFLTPFLIVSENSRLRYSVLLTPGCLKNAVGARSMRLQGMVPVQSNAAPIISAALDMRYSFICQLLAGHHAERILMVRVR